MVCYRIQINTARKGAPPIWRDLVDENDDPCEWGSEAEARAALADEDRGDSAELMRYGADGIGRVA